MNQIPVPDDILSDILSDIPIHQLVFLIQYIFQFIICQPSPEVTHLEK